MKRISPLYILILVVSILCASFQSHAIKAPSSIKLLDGRILKVPKEANSKKVAKTLLPKGKKYHSLSNYGPLMASFMFWMVASEVWYCDKTKLGLNATFEETPTCRTDLYQMSQDPSMAVGIVAMATTSFAFNKWSDKKSRDVLLRSLGKKAKTPFKLLQAFSQSVGMGFGITMQTLTTSLYNSPSIGKCFKEIKRTILSGEGSALDAMKTKICDDGWNSFLDLENGTLSEITIAITSLMVSTVATGAVITSLKGVGFVVGHILGKTNVIGIGMTGVMILANWMIEFFDRYIEKYIRAYHHNRRSKAFIKEDFANILKHLDEYDKSGKFFSERRELLPCSNYKGRCRAVGHYQKKILPLAEDIKNYSYNINYRRRAMLNTFIDSQANWRRKLSGVLEVFANYKDFLKLILQTREYRLKYGESLEGTDYNYNAFFMIGRDPKEELSKLDVSEFRGGLYLNEDQKELLTKSISGILKLKTFKRIENTSRQTIPGLISKIAKQALIEVETNKFEDLRFSLWKLKEISNSYFSFQERSLLAASPEEEKIIDTFVKTFSAVSSVSPLTALQLQEFRGKGLSFEAQEPEDDGSGDVVNRGRKNFSVDTEAIDVLSLHEDTQKEVVHNEHKLANLLLHSACNANEEIMFNFNDGDISKITLPNLIDKSFTEALDCNPNQLSFETGVFKESSSNDFYFLADGKKKVFFESTSAMHAIYTYNGKKYIGLFDLLTDPDVPLKWSNKTELLSYWDDKIMPQYYSLLGVSREKYYTLLYTEFYLFNRDFRGVNKESVVQGPLEHEELSYRKNTNLSHRYFGGDGYYNNMSPGQTFMDQVRTFNYILKRIGSSTAHRKLLDDVGKDLVTLLSLLDFQHHTPQQPVVGPLNLETLFENPLIKLIGLENYNKFEDLRTSVAEKINKAANSFKGVPDFKSKDDDLTKIEADMAKSIIEKSIFTAVKEMFDKGLVAEIFTDYLTAEGFLYSKKL